MSNFIILITIFGLGFIAVIFFFNKKLTELKKQHTDPTLLEWLKTMQQSVESTNKMINQSMQSNSSQMVQTLQENTRQLNERLDRTAAVIRDVSTGVGQMNEIGRSMRELQDFLKSPKLRGN